MTTAFELYRMRGKYCDAVRVALRMDDGDLLAQLLAECDDKGMTQQMRSAGFQAFSCAACFCFNGFFFSLCLSLYIYFVYSSIYICISPCRPMMTHVEFIVTSK